MPMSTSVALLNVEAPLVRCVNGVVGVVTKEEVIRVHATTVVAVVTHGHGAGITTEESPRGSVSCCLATRELEGSVPIGPPARHPLPTSVERDELDLGHEPIYNFIGKHLKTPTESALGGQRV